MKATSLVMIFLFASLCFLGCGDMQSSSVPVEPTGFEQQNLNKGPEKIKISFLLCPITKGDLSVTIGEYVAKGLIADEGFVRSEVSVSAGPDPNPDFVKGTLLMTSDNVDGTIRIGWHIRPSDADFDFPVLNVLNGQWNVLGGTGYYEHLHGQGTLETKLVFDLENECAASEPGLKLVIEFIGQANFDNGS